MVEPHKRITGKDRDRLSKTVVAQYRKGASIRSIAADLNRSYGFVHRMLLDAEVQLRGRGGNVRRTSK